MGFGLPFAGAWIAANEAVKAVAGTIAIGAKVVGQVPVIMAALENQTRSTIQNTRETITKTGVGFLKAVDITATQWKGWMDVKAAQVLQGAGLPVDAFAEARQAALNNIATRQGWEQKQSASNAALGSMREKVNQANAQRSAAAQRLKQKIVAKGKATAARINRARAATDDLLVLAGALAAQVAGGVIAKGYNAIKTKFSKTDANSAAVPCPKPAADEQLRAQLLSQQALLHSAKEAAHVGGPNADKLNTAIPDLEKQIDVGTKALLAGDVYNDNRGGTPSVAPGWSRLSDQQIHDLGLNPHDFHPDGSKFRAALYRSADGHYTLAFKGTDPTSIQDVKNDVLQYMGLESDDNYYLRAEQLAKSIYQSESIGPNFDITGHSLGGGLTLAAVASLAAVAGNNDPPVRGVTFNAAWLNPKTAPDADLTSMGKRVDAYVVDGDPVTAAQADLAELGGDPRAIGAQHVLPAPDSGGILGKHVIEGVEGGLLKKGAASEAAMRPLLGVSAATGT